MSITGRIQYPCTSPLIPFQREVLPNGVTLITKEVHTVPLAAVDLWISTGSANEEPHESGISHFLEHMFFKGTPQRPVGMMDREIKSLGGYNNAATSYDFTHYYVVVPSEHTELALEILVDALLNMALPPDEIDRERQVIFEEIARRDDSPHGKLYDEFFSHVFKGSSYERPILGTNESLSQINQDSFLDYRRRFYAPDHIHLSISGDIEHRHVTDKVHTLLGSLNPTQKKKSIDKADWTQISTTHFELTKDVQQTYLCWGIRTPAIQGTEDEIALDLISTLLGEGRSSRLEYRLVEQTGLCSSLDVFAWSLDHTGLFGLEACYPAENEHEVMRIIEEEMERIRTEKIPEEEMIKAKVMMLTNHDYHLEKIASIAGTLGRSSCCNQIEHALSYKSKVMDMTATKAQDALNRCCPFDRVVTGVVRPRETAQ